MEHNKQITIGKTTWCKMRFGWIGPNLKAPGFLLRRKLEKLAKMPKDRAPA